MTDPHIRRPDKEAAQWRAIVEAAVDAIIVIDSRGLIESFNPGAVRMFGYRDDEVVGRNVSMLMPEPDSSQHDRYIQRYVATHVPRIIGVGRDVTGKRKDGTLFAAHLSVGQFVIEGEAKFTGIVRDLTDRVNLEKKLREEAGLVRIGELAAVLAHEVKNPLAAVSGAVQILGEKLQTPEDRDIANEVLRRVDALSALMTDLLFFARPPKPRLAPVDVNALIDNLVSFLRLDPVWQQVESRVTGPSVVAFADAELLKVALQNLLLNALQAMDGHGALGVMLGTEGDLIHIDIVDSGRGIPAEVQPKLFTPFFTTKTRGTGLGLATVRRIADAHRGEIRVIFTSAEGTAIRLSVPAHHRDAERWSHS